MNVSFDQREIRDLAVAWVVLGVAFTIFLERDLILELWGPTNLPPLDPLPGTFLVSLATVGVGFLLHELAHKFVAVHFGQQAAFRADYQMLGFALLGALIGFLFAAPGAVVHGGRTTRRENGLIAVAGPVTNLALVAVFALGVVAILFVRVPALLGDLVLRGVTINALLAGFNMIPFGPLDGRTVLDWSTLAYLAVAVPAIGLALFVVVLGFGV